MRIFVPATPAGLAAAVVAGELGPAPVAAFAVTGSLREAFSDGDEEELALVATEAAAWESLRLLGADHTDDADRRRLVITAEVSDGAAVHGPSAPLAELGGVLLTTELPLTAVLSVLADPASLSPLVSAAASAVAAGRTAQDVADPEALAADPGLAALDEVLATPLLWFDAVEIPDLLLPANPRSRP